MKLLSPLRCTLLTSFFAFGSAGAQTINWGNAAPVPASTIINFDSEGNALDGSFTWEFGVFDAGFDPALEDPETWFQGDNWIALDSATVAEGTYDPAISFFSDSFVITAAEDVYKGRQAYIFGYNQLSPVDETTEWVLITDDDGLNGDDWILPPHQDQSGLTLEWRVSNATTPVFGGLNNVDGPGETSDTPPAFELQTNTFPVPEPGTFLFYGVAGLLGARRRRSRRSRR